MGLDGTGVGIAIIDSGILDSRDLLAAWQQCFEYFPCGLQPELCFGPDEYRRSIWSRHARRGRRRPGTRMRRQGAGYTKSFRGIAPNARLINLRVLDGNGVGTESAVIAGN